MSTRENEQFPDRLRKAKREVDANSISDMNFQYKSLEDAIQFLLELDEFRNSRYCDVDPSINQLRDWLIELAALKRAAYNIRVSIADAERELEEKGRKWRR